ncbi:MAG: GIY-YIG nuclease family protein [Verrucomicrobiota bacterium]
MLQSESDDGLYIGFSSDLKRRLKEHQSGRSMSTRHRGPWVLIYYESYLCEEDALGRERFLKSGAGRQLLQKQCAIHFQTRPARKGQKPREA